MKNISVENLELVSASGVFSDRKTWGGLACFGALVAGAAIIGSGPIGTAVAMGSGFGFGVLAGACAGLST